MFAIFRKRAAKLSGDLEKLRKQEDALIERADAHIEQTRELGTILYREMEEAQQVIDKIVRPF